jgi:cyclopropane fatty-acyl-phospholipid synthase-like methyltransferase
MSNLEKEVAYSLDGNEELIGYLPYLLQDLWGFGSEPGIIIKLIEKCNISDKPGVKILDLGCGKGYVSINIAKELGLSVLGIDAMPSFIEEAKKYADEYGVDKLCRFEIGNIRNAVEEIRNYDIIIWGSVGHLFGCVKETLLNISKCMTNDGFIIFDDGYVKNEFKNDLPEYPDIDNFYFQVEEAGLKVVDQIISESSDMLQENDRINLLIQKRAVELGDKYPSKKHLFDAYIQSQLDECDILNNRMTCAAFLLRRK